MDLLSDANIITVLIVLYFICQIIFELQTYFGPHIFWTLFSKYATRLHLNHILSESCDDINLTDLLMPYFVIFCVSYCHVSSDFIAQRICKTKKTAHAEKTVSVKLLFKNNKPNKCILDNRNMRYRWCCTVCSLWDAEQMGVEAHRLATFTDMQDRTNYPVTNLAQSGLFYDADLSTVQCCRCLRVLSGSDDMRNERSWHEEGCDFMNVNSPTYRGFFQQDQESVIHQQISEARARYPSETVQNAAGSQQEGSVPLAASQSTEEEGFLPSRDCTSSTLDRSLLIRRSASYLTSVRDATFTDYDGRYARTSGMSGDHTISEPADMLYTEVTPTRRETEGVQMWQSHTEIGQLESAVNPEAWASTQSVQVFLRARHQEAPQQNTADTRRRRHSRQRHRSGQQQCCCIN